MKKFAENLKEIRVSMGYTCNDISSIIKQKHGIDINYKTISRYENGQREPSIENLKLLADALEISIDELVDFKIQTVSPEEKIRRIQRELSSLLKVVWYFWNWSKDEDLSNRFILNSDWLKMWCDFV